MLLNSIIFKNKSIIMLLFIYNLSIKKYNIYKIYKDGYTFM